MYKLITYFTWLYIIHQLDGSTKITISGELQQWHKVTLTLDVPSAKETDKSPNPYTDLQLNIRFTHESGSPDYLVPGYFAADGNAAETSATEGNKWRAHLSPDKIGQWKYTIDFKGSELSLIHI